MTLVTFHTFTQILHKLKVGDARGLYQDGGWTNSGLQNYFWVDKTKPIQSCFDGTMTLINNFFCLHNLEAWCFWFFWNYFLWKKKYSYVLVFKLLLLNFGIKGISHSQLCAVCQPWYSCLWWRRNEWVTEFIWHLNTVGQIKS